MNYAPAHLEFIKAWGIKQEQSKYGGSRMKNSFLYAAIAFALGLGGALEAISTTFAEWDKMTKEQQGDWLVDRSDKLYAWLEKKDPAKAKCMLEKFTPKPGTGVSVGLIELEKQIKSVPEEKRDKYQVEDIMAGFIIEDLCGAVTSNPQQKSDEASQSK